VTRVLFVCIQNAGRSQMARAFATEHGFEARSAGSAPATRVHPEVAAAMLEVGHDIAAEQPHALARADAEWADLVVTMGCGDACPVVPGVRYLDWQLPDPHGMGVDGVREVRDDIRARIEALAAAELG
jgi:arsenate reductase